MCYVLLHNIGDVSPIMIYVKKSLKDLFIKIPFKLRPKIEFQSTIKVVKDPFIIEKDLSQLKNHLYGRKSRIPRIAIRERDAHRLYLAANEPPNSLGLESRTQGQPQRPIPTKRSF